MKFTKNCKRAAIAVAAYVLCICILLIAMLLTLPSCAAPKIIHEKETVIEYRDRIIRDTTEVVIEKEVEKIVTRDTVSHLENKYAKSDACVTNGFLRHSLESVPQIIRVPVEVHVTDTIKIESDVKEVIKEVKVEKELSWFKHLKLALFPWILLSLIVSLCYIFRKPLLTIIKTIIKI